MSTISPPKRGRPRTRDVVVAVEKRYHAKPNSISITDDDAQVIGTVLEALAQTNGIDINHLSTESILAEAERLDSALHRFFEWDDTQAAHRYRMEQARRLARSFTIEIVTVKRHERTSWEAPGLINLRYVTGEERSRAYFPVTNVLDSPELLAQVREQSITDLQAWVTRYQAYRNTPSLRDVNDIMSLIEDWIAERS